jgi:hypothetical protein
MFKNELHVELDKEATLSLKTSDSVNVTERQKIKDKRSNALNVTKRDKND